jgi:acyl-coenzyme A synthetase/AMP-(fatty) acid ligase
MLIEYRPTGLESQPNLFLRWEPLTADPDRPFGSIRRYISTFDAIHPRTVRALLAGSDQPDVGYFQGYGQSETGPLTISVRTRDFFEQVSPRNVGIPIPEFTQARVVDESGNPLPPGAEGQIEARTGGLMLGYVGSDTPPLNDGWWGMQDIGRMNEDGTLELLDRVVDHADTLPSIIAIEDALLEALPELAEVVLVKPEPDELAAVVCLQDGESLDPERWAALAEEHGIGDVPVHEWDWDDMPFTGSWKVRRHLLARAVRERAAEQMTT